MASSGPPHIVIGTPCYGGAVTHLFALSLLKLQAACIARGIGLSFRLLRGDALITRARNIIVSDFLATPEATHLLFIDADIGFTPEQVFALVEIDKPVAGAVYPVKNLDWAQIRRDIAAGRAQVPASTLTYVVEFEDPAHIVPVNGFARARYVGTGFMMVKRQVFEAMAARHPELRFRQAHSITNVALDAERLYAYFDCVIEPGTGLYLSEDYTFCRRWTAMGGEIWVDLNSRLTHVGAMDFEGNLMSVFNPVGE